MSEDIDLVDRARAGSREAFSELVRRHHHAVRAYLARFVRGRDVIDDLAQEVFVSAHASLGGLPERGAVRLWLLGIGRRRVADHLRAEGRRGRGRETDLTAAAVLRWLDVAARDDNAHLHRRDQEVAPLEECLKTLPAERAALVNEHYFEGKTAMEIAGRTGATSTPSGRT